MGDNPYGRQRREKKKLRRQMEAYYNRQLDYEERDYDNEKDD
jgi:hypothetical protein